MLNIRNRDTQTNISASLHIHMHINIKRNKTNLPQKLSSCNNADSHTTLGLGTHVFVFLGQQVHEHAWTPRFLHSQEKGNEGFSTILYDPPVL